MARKLNKKQKEILDALIIDGIKSVDSISGTVKGLLRSYGDYESMDSDIDRYLSDGYFRRENGRKER